ncbi:hypothetical protein HYU11_05325 [Candidatus Woesearchaeota archaeon]|nr:hypothetical protein [Candidatus Woesearchaeota archaeon]
MTGTDSVRKQAKQIMDDFMNALDRLGEISMEYGLERKEQTRPDPKEQDFPEFRKSILKNAPKKNNDFIIAEKKKW